MSYHKLFYWVIGSTLLLLPLVGCGAPAASPMPVPPTPTPEPEVKILFVGNSLTYSGLGRNIEFMAGTANPPLVIETLTIREMGAWLETMWKDTKIREYIGEGDYDVIVLQEDIPETDVDTFHEYASKFVAEIKKSGAEPVLFMAWSYPELGWISMEEIAQAHRDIATELGVDVAPVGLAFQRAMEERPELDLYDTDKVHPSRYGDYLEVFVVYATVFGESPISLAYLPSEVYPVTEEEAAFLQRIAWETVQEYQAQK